MTVAPEQVAWEIIREVEDTDPGLSLTHAAETPNSFGRFRRATGGVGSVPTPGAYLGWLEVEAARQQELAQLYPDEAPRYTHRHTLLSAIADRLRDLGLDSGEGRHAPGSPPTPLEKEPK